jgi:two-component system response regulator YesN
MELESVGYCLKPFDYDEIAKYLKRIRQKLDQKRVQQSAPWVLSDYMVRKDDAAVSYMKQFYLSQGIDFETQDIMAVCVTGLPHIEQLACVCSVPIGCQKQVCLIRETEKDSFLYELKKRVKKTVLHIGCSSRIESAAQAPRHILESFRCACQFFCESKPVFLKEAPKIWNDRKVIKKFQEELQRGEEGIRRGFEELREAFESGNCSIDAAVMIRNIVELMSEKVQKESVFDWDYDSLIEEYGHVRKMLRILEEQCLLSLKSETERTITNSTFHQIYQFVEENYRSPVTASDIAEKFHINNCYVSQLFRKETGKTFTEYITEKRIQYVCTLLKHSEQNINEIAEQAGFKDYFYFSRVFRKIMKCTPTEYRNLAN